MPLGQRSATSEATSLVVVGGGLAGCEAAFQAASRGCAVTLYEMRPMTTSAAHQGGDLAELVCSNSLRGASLTNAVGLLKEEMHRMGSLVHRAAKATAVPAGRALAVDRLAFSQYITQAIETHPRIEVVRERVDSLPTAPLAILATGPLTSPAMAAEVQALLGETSLYFYDAIAPTVYADSIDYEVVFRASRYEDGEGDYLNVPLYRDGYERFVDELVAAEPLPLHGSEAALYFEGCLPIEEMARRGRDTLAYGPMKPVGLTDPKTGRRPHGVVQLRQEDKAGILYNLVGFQTRLRIPEQRRLFRSLPGLGEAVFARYGSVHRNTFINAPEHLSPSLELRCRPGLYIAGQMAGVEGYVESAALGLLAGINAAFAARGETAPEVPAETAHGALLRHLGHCERGDFQPSNVNYGLFLPLQDAPRRLPRREKVSRFAERAFDALEDWKARVGGVPA